MKVSLFGLFLVGLSLCAVSGLPVCDRVADELGWKSSQLLTIVSTRLDPLTLRYMGIWGTVLVTLAPISFAALEFAEVGSRQTAGENLLMEPNIDQIYQQRQLDLGRD